LAGDSGILVPPNDSWNESFHKERSKNSGGQMCHGAWVVKKWKVVFTKQAQKDAKKISQSGLRPQAEKLLKILEQNPYKTPPPFENLVGDLSGACSRRINIQHRLVYQILEDSQTVKVIRMWTYYE
jgi:Txe/YoeB family toxin of toxin-antitoxin system